MYDRQDALLYLDLPYYGTNKYYQALFSKSDHEKLARTLRNVKGKFLLSYNDCEFVREVYRDFYIEEIQRNHTGVKLLSKHIQTLFCM